MSDEPEESKNAPPAPTQPGGDLLKYLAVGRLARNKEGQLLPDKHRLIAHNLPKKDDDLAKQVKAHLKAIMKRGGHKLEVGKRIRLKSNEFKYDVHILVDEVDKDKMKTIVFFAVTNQTFGRYHSIPSMLRDLKGGFYESVNKQALFSGASVQRQCQLYFQRLMNFYGRSPLRAVEAKVDAVKEVMEDSVRKALVTVENLEDMDEKSETMEAKSKTFVKRAKTFNDIQKSSSRKLYILLALAILGVILWFTIPAIIKWRNNRNSGSSDDTTQCASPSPPDNGSFDPADIVSSTSAVNKTATVICNSGYAMQTIPPLTSIQCTANITTNGQTNRPYWNYTQSVYSCKLKASLANLTISSPAFGVNSTKPVFSPTFAPDQYNYLIKNIPAPTDPTPPTPSTPSTSNLTRLDYDLRSKPSSTSSSHSPLFQSLVHRIQATNGSISLDVVLNLGDATSGVSFQSCTYVPKADPKTYQPCSAFSSIRTAQPPPFSSQSVTLPSIIWTTANSTVGFRLNVTSLDNTLFRLYSFNFTSSS